MIDGLRQTNFVGAYHFSDIISNVLSDPLEYMAGGLEAFCDGQEVYSFLPPFPRKSALHRFAAFMIDALFWEADVDGYEPPDKAKIESQRMMAKLSRETTGELWVERAFRAHGIVFDPFTDWSRQQEELSADAAYYWFQELRMSEEYERLIDHLTRDVFSILFANRTVLRDLNLLIAQDLLDADPPEPDYVEVDYGRFLTTRGRARRTSIPAWAKRAVFYRDRGRCCFCHRDLGGLLSPLAELAYDHIVPLAEGGINDVTNLQLLCGPCNRSKAAKHDLASNFYGVWYDDSDLADVKKS